MEPLAWRVVSDLEGTDLAGFLTIVGCLAAVIAGIPAAMTGSNAAKSPRIMGTLAFVHGALLVFGPAVLLAPLFTVNSRAAIFGGIIYAAMLMLRLIISLPRTVGDMVMLAAGPWILGFGSVTVSWLLGPAVPGAGLPLVDVLLEVALVSYAGFWIAFPMFFFGWSSFKEQKARFKQIPVLYILGLAVILCAELFGLWTCLNAWRGTLPVVGEPFTSTLPTLFAVALQVASEVRLQVRTWRQLQ